jgi:SLOG in TRPM, prokaryote
MTVHGTVVAGDSEIRTIHVAGDIDEHALARVLSDAGLPSRVPVVVLVGGAGNMAAELQTALTRLFAEAIVPAVARAAGCLVDGGTKAGVMALAGDARQRTGARFPHVGVVAEGTVQWPGRASSNPQAAALEPNHSHVVVVPGDQWEDSAPWLARVVARLRWMPRPSSSKREGDQPDRARHPEWSQDREDDGASSPARPPARTRPWGPSRRRVGNKPPLLPVGSAAPGSAPMRTGRTRHSGHARPAG